MQAGISDGLERTHVYFSLDGLHACVLGVVPCTRPSTDDAHPIRHARCPPCVPSVMEESSQAEEEKKLLPLHHLIQFGRISPGPSWTNQRVSFPPHGIDPPPDPAKGTSIGSHPGSNPRPPGLPSLSGPPVLASGASVHRCRVPSRASHRRWTCSCFPSGRTWIESTDDRRGRGKRTMACSAMVPRTAFHRCDATTRTRKREERRGEERRTAWLTDVQERGQARGQVRRTWTRAACTCALGRQPRGERRHGRHALRGSLRVLAVPAQVHRKSRTSAPERPRLLRSRRRARRRSVQRHEDQRSRRIQPRGRCARRAKRFETRTPRETDEADARDVLVRGAVLAWGALGHALGYAALAVSSFQSAGL